jgi:hypothetical protein
VFLNDCALLRHWSLSRNDIIPFSNITTMSLSLSSPARFCFEMATVQKVAIILDGTRAWHDWLEDVRTIARAGKVREYVDLSKSADEIKKLGRSISHYSCPGSLSTRYRRSDGSG